MSMAIAITGLDGAILVADGCTQRPLGNKNLTQDNVDKIEPLTDSIFAIRLGIEHVAASAIKALRTRLANNRNCKPKTLFASLESCLGNEWQDFLSRLPAGVDPGHTALGVGVLCGGLADGVPFLAGVIHHMTLPNPTRIFGEGPGHTFVIGFRAPGEQTQFYQDIEQIRVDIPWELHEGPSNVCIERLLTTSRAAIRSVETQDAHTGGIIRYAIVRKGFPVVKLEDINADTITTSTLDASQVNIINLTVTGVITCQAGSSYTGNPIGTAYTAAKCTVANADHTADIVSAMAYRSNIRAVDCDTTIISGGKIITGLLTANNITAGTMAANRISGGTIGACTISANNITTGGMNAARITAGTMSVSRITIDGNVNFKPGATYRMIYGVDALRLGSGGTGSNLYVGRSVGGNDLILNSPDQVWLQGNSAYVWGKAGKVSIVAEGAGNDIEIFSADDIILNVADSGSTMYIKDWDTTGGAWGTGRIYLSIGGVTRHIQLDD